MPIYEYLCEACGRIAEVMQKVSDPPPRTCPECGAERLAKLVSRSAFQLKGGGWYADLYASPQGSKSGSASPKEPASSAAAPAKKESAPASPAPAAAPAKPAKSGE